MAQETEILQDISFRSDMLHKYQEFHSDIYCFEAYTFIASCFSGSVYALL
jgi:hypothetical protein